ncbi:MAG: hypothetical protein K5765_06870 [Clostridia bacterium]|nr:hypothetical protein [Clostridia bacterium]
MPDKKEEEKIIVSENEQGNPYHKPAGSSEGGQFTSKDEDGFGVFVLKKEEEKSKFGISLENIKKFIGEKKEVKNQKAQAFIDSVWNDYVTSDMQNYYDGLSKEQYADLLKKSQRGFSEEYLKFATDKQLKALIVAEGILNAPIQLDQQIILANEEKKGLEAQIQTDINNKTAKLFTVENDFGTISNVWYGSVGLKDFESKYNVDSNGTSPIDRKKEYYDEILNNPESNIAQKADATAKLKKLNNWISLGEEYLKLKKEVNAEYVDKLENIEAKIGELTTKRNQYNDDLPVFKLCNDFIEQFQDRNAAYSQYRKNNAVWIDNKWLKAHSEYGSDVVSASVKYFGNKFDLMWKKMTSVEREQLKDYTGGGFSKYNRPLRNLSHPGWSGWAFAEKVTNLTNAIDKCVWDEDIWVQRGIDDSKMFQLPGENKLYSLYELGTDKLQSLVGTSFKDNGFFSAGAAKGTGFFHNVVIFNTYCPKGTKMAYMNTKGHYSNSSENEMILQRGYSYKITKIEKKGGRFFIDCEVILGSDNDKITDKNLLNEIGEKYLY